ncbi:class I SAM-dependent methyltransferase [Thalassobellus sediminis]|uniref:class I SAM-dependent methyltransferase n=1 Tax=Thalassobellus sediminis TaxID=3367753 RepID=UPI0037B2F64A
MKMIKETAYQIKKSRTLINRYFKNKFGLGKSDYSEITRYSGTSFPFGKKETIVFIEKICPDKNSKILDVGPGQGTYFKLLKEKGYKYFDAVEIYQPYIKKFELKKMYQNVFHCDIVDFKYDEHYDIIIMGDILEHLKIKRAKDVITYAKEHSDLLIAAVPYQMKQIGSQLDGSGDHRQADLTREIFLKRYPGFKLLIDNKLLGVFYHLK